MARALFASRPSRPPIQTAFPRRRGFQRSCFCSCGRPLDTRLSVCRACAWEVPYSRRCFGGYRSDVLARDAHRCRTCGSSRVLHVHHRRPGIHEPEWLVTLCASCHARIHRLQAIRSYLLPVFLPFWEEQHPDVPRQLQFDLEALAA